MNCDKENKPNWQVLHELAAVQSGIFSVTQAEDAGFSLPLLTYHVNAGRFERVLRGIYRVSYFPEAGAMEELITFWLWSNQQGIYSHETALALYELTNLMPAQLHLSVPTSWSARRLKVPPPLTLHYQDLDTTEWFEQVPVTTAARALDDCIDAHSPPEFLEPAIKLARARGLIDQRAAKALLNKLTKSLSGEHVL